MTLPADNVHEMLFVESYEASLSTSFPSSNSNEACYVVWHGGWGNRWWAGPRWPWAWRLHFSDWWKILAGAAHCLEKATKEEYSSWGWTCVNSLQMGDGKGKEIIEPWNSTYVSQEMEDCEPIFIDSLKDGVEITVASCPNLVLWVWSTWRCDPMAL